MFALFATPASAFFHGDLFDVKGIVPKQHPNIPFFTITNPGTWLTRWGSFRYYAQVASINEESSHLSFHIDPRTPENVLFHAETGVMVETMRCADSESGCGAIDPETSLQRIDDNVIDSINKECIYDVTKFVPTNDVIDKCFKHKLIADVEPGAYMIVFSDREIYGSKNVFKAHAVPLYEYLLENAEDFEIKSELHMVMSIRSGSPTLLRDPVGNRRLAVSLVVPGGNATPIEYIRIPPDPSLNNREPQSDPRATLLHIFVRDCQREDETVSYEDDLETLLLTGSEDDIPFDDPKDDVSMDQNLRVEKERGELIESAAKNWFKKKHHAACSDPNDKIDLKMLVTVTY